MQYRNKKVEFKVETDFIYRYFFCETNQRKSCDQIPTRTYYKALIFNNLSAVLI